MRELSSYKPYGFTVLEMLGIMLVLSILVGLILPTLRLVNRSAEKQRAAAEATALAQAVMLYRQEFGHWPLVNLVERQTNEYSSFTAGITNNAFNIPTWLNPSDRNQLPITDIEQRLVIQALTDPRENPFLRPLIEINDNSLDAAGNFVDPWRIPYIIVMDPPSHIGPNKIGNLPVVVFSFGPPATGSKGLRNLIFSCEVSP